MPAGVNDGPPARLDTVIATLAGVSRSRAQSAITAGLVTVAGEVVTKASRIVPSGQALQYAIPERPPLSAAPESIALDVVYEDEDLLVVNKPRGMVVHPSAGHGSGTVVNAVLGRVGQLPGSVEFRPGVVHRLDKDTSGLLLMAKSEQAMVRLAQMVKNHEVDRRYLAIVRGVPREVQGRVDAPVGRHPKMRLKQWVVPGGRAAVTEYALREVRAPFSVLALRLHTGRTHQIRVHMAYRGWPVVSDPLYDTRKGGSGQLLHAATLGLVHPLSGRFLEVRAPVPEDMHAFWTRHGGSEQALVPPQAEGPAREVGDR